MSATQRGRGAAVAAVLGYAVLWGGSTAYLFTRSNEDWFTAVLVMGIFGVAFSGLAWLLTRGATAPPIEVRRPPLESGAIIVYLALFYAALFLGFGMSALRATAPAGPVQDILVLGGKLGVHVLAPALLLIALGAQIRPLMQAGLRGRKFWRTLVVMGAAVVALQAVLSPSLREVAALRPAPATLVWAAPLSLAWMSLEAGLCEEFLFRAVTQTRFAAWFRSQWAGVALTSLLFGLAHAPGLFLRGGPEIDGWSTDPLQVVAYTIAVLSPSGLFFGLIYARTKSLLLVVLLHGLGDMLPNMDDIIRSWA
jgi:membrane protease YdiL (CAAX protease family)